MVQQEKANAILDRILSGKDKMPDHKAQGKENDKLIKELNLLLKVPGNNVCADCPDKGVRDGQPSRCMCRDLWTLKDADRHVVHCSTSLSLSFLLQDPAGPQSIWASSFASSAQASTAT